MEWMKNLLLVLGLLFLTACNQVEMGKTSTTPEPVVTVTPITVTTEPTKIPEGCMVWFDGCNECMVEDQKLAGCTKIKCEIMEDPECRVMVDTESEVPWEEMIVTVGPEMVDCNAFRRICMVVDGKPFPDWIDDFEYEPGYNYKLKIEKYKREEELLDMGEYVYQLVEILEKNPVE